MVNPRRSAERYWIEHYARLYPPLTNAVRGGGSLPSNEARKAIAKAIREKKASNKTLVGVAGRRRGILPIHGLSRYKGVVWRLDGDGNNSWDAVISLNGRSTVLGSYPTERDAALAYNEAMRRVLGPNVVVNRVT